MIPVRSIALMAALLLPSESSLSAWGKRPHPKAPVRIVNPANTLEKVNDSTDSSNVAPGSSGALVLRAQILLARARFSPGEIDGRFGPDLEIAVKGYQDRHHLKPTGVVDAEM